MENVAPLPDQSYLLEILNYDPETGQLSWRERPKEMFKTTKDCRRWNNRYANQRAFTSVLQGASGGYLRGKINGRLYRAHRIIWKLVTGTDPKVIDHRNGKRTDNRWKNLRNVSHHGNSLNCGKYTTNTSGRTGVFWDKRRNRWGVSLSSKILGYFDDKNEAIQVRLNAEKAAGYFPNLRR